MPASSVTSPTKVPVVSPSTIGSSLFTLFEHDVVRETLELQRPGLLTDRKRVGDLGVLELVARGPRDRIGGRVLGELPLDLTGLGPGRALLPADGRAVPGLRLVADSVLLELTWTGREGGEPGADDGQDAECHADRERPAGDPRPPLDQEGDEQHVGGDAERDEGRDDRVDGEQDPREHERDEQEAEQPEQRGGVRDEEAAAEIRVHSVPGE